MKKQSMEKVVPYLFLLPFGIFFLVLFIGPALNSLFISFSSYRGYGQMRMVGFKNYFAILNYKVFWIELRNVIIYWAIHVFPMMLLSFGMALLVSSPLFSNLSRYKILLFLPRVIAPVIAALIFRALFGTENGLVNSLFNLDIDWLHNDFTSRIVISTVLVWRDFGYWFVVFLAGLTSISPELIDASVVDGANSFQRITKITIPLMNNIIKFAFIIDGISSLRLFSIPNILIGQPDQMAPTAIAPVMNLLVESIQSGNFGRASAVGWLLFIVIGLLTIVQSACIKDVDV